MNKYEAQLQNSLMLKNNLEEIVRKLIVSIFLTFVVLVSLVAEVFALTASEVFEKTSKSTVIVIASDSSGKDIAFGTGVVLPNGKVVTNFHVVTDATKLRVTFEKLTFFATIEKSNKQRDLCTLSVPGLNANPATVGTSKEIKIGSKVYAIGTPKV